MAKLPNIKSISRELFKDPPDWLDLLLAPLNQFIILVYNALNRNLTFEENIRCNIKEITFTTPSTYDGTYSATVSKFTPVIFPRGVTSTAQALISMNFFEISPTGQSVYIEKGIFINWYDNNGNITINFIAGLKPSTKYLTRFLVL